MTLEQLIYFSEVYRQKSINAASFNLNISQQSLSSSIRSLEKEFSSTFFERTHKGVSATPEGERFYRSSQNILHEYLSLQHDLSKHTKPHYCKVALFCALSASIASQLFTALNDTFSDIFFDFTSFYFDDLYNLSISVQPDIIFACISENLDANTKNLLTESYTLKYISHIPKHLYLWCNKNSSLANYKTITPQHLNSASMLLPNYAINKNTNTSFFHPFDDINFKECYFPETENILTNLILNNPFCTLEICSERHPLLHPSLLHEPNVLLKPLSPDFGANYFVLLYKKEYENFYYPIADFLTQNYNL